MKKLIKRFLLAVIIAVIVSQVMLNIKEYKNTLHAQAKGTFLAQNVVDAMNSEADIPDLTDEEFDRLLAQSNYNAAPEQSVIVTMETQSAAVADNSVNERETVNSLQNVADSETAPQPTVVAEAANAETANVDGDSEGEVSLTPNDTPVVAAKPVVSLQAGMSLSKPMVYSQKDEKWGAYLYGYADKEGTVPNNIYYTGCALLSVANAIYYLNGTFISPQSMADYAMANDLYSNGVGTKHVFFESFARDYGSTYGFKYDGKITSFETLSNYLLNGGVAIARVPSHFIAVVAYKPDTAQYLVLDSYDSPKRNTTTAGDWKTEDQLQTGRLKADWFKLFSRL